MTKGSRRWTRSLTTSPDVVTNLRLVVLALLCLETLSGLYDDAVDPDLVVSLGILVHAALALAAGAALLFRYHRSGVCLFVLAILLAGFTRPIGVDFFVVQIFAFVVGLRARGRIAVMGMIGGIALSMAYGVRSELLSAGEGWFTGLFLLIFSFCGGLAGLGVRVVLGAVERALLRARELQVEAVRIRRRERRRLAADLQLVLEQGLSELQLLTMPVLDAKVIQLRHVLVQVDEVSRRLLVQTRILLDALRVREVVEESAASVGVNKGRRLGFGRIRWVGGAMCLLIATATPVLSGASVVSSWVAVLAWASAALAFRRPTLGALSAGVCLIGVAIVIAAGATPGRWDLMATVVLCVVISANFPKRIGALILTGLPFLAFIGFMSPNGYSHAMAHTYLGVLALLLGWSWQHLRAQHSAATTELLRSTAERDGVLDQERESLARELHDVVAHQLSLTSMMIMASSASTEPNELREVVARLHSNTASARSELETLLDGLQRETPGTGPQVTPTRMASNLAKRLEQGGFQVQMHIDPASDELETLQMITVVRVMQESTTNILRYSSSGAACEFMVRVDQSTIMAEVASEMNNAPRRSPLSSGWGLRGLRERTDLLGGSFYGGPRHGKWVVAIELPHHQLV